MEFLNKVFIVERSEDSEHIYKYCEGTFSTLQKGKDHYPDILEWKDWSEGDGSTSIPKDGVWIQIRRMEIDKPPSPLVDFLESKGERPDGFICALCFKHISPDQEYASIPPNYYHEDCVTHGWEEHGNATK